MKAAATIMAECARRIPRRLAPVIQGLLITSAISFAACEGAEAQYAPSRSADLNGDDAAEQVFVMQGQPPQSAKVFAVDGSRQALPGWEGGVEVDAARVIGLPLVADVDGDGNLEVIVQTSSNTIFSIGSDGTPLSAWTYTSQGPATGCDVGPSASWDDQGNVRVTFTHYGDLFAMDDEGNLLAGYPQRISGYACPAPIPARAVRASTANNPPVLSPIGNFTVQAGSTVSFSMTAYDPDNDVMWVYWSRNLPGAYLNENNGEFTWTTTEAQAGSWSATFSVTDRKGGVDSETITITVIPMTNNPPVITPIANQTVAGGSELRFKIQAYDPDGDVINVKWTNAPRGATLDLVTGDVYWKPEAGQAGVYRITFYVWDSHGLTVSTTVTVTVTLGKNRAPVITAIPKRWIKAGRELRFAIKAYDPDGDRIYAYLKKPPRGASVGANTGIFYWKPLSWQVGTRYITFQVKDSRGAVATRVAAIVVTR